MRTVDSVTGNRIKIRLDTESKLKDGEMVLTLFTISEAMRVLPQAMEMRDFVEHVWESFDFLLSKYYPNVEDYLYDMELVRRLVNETTLN